MLKLFAFDLDGTLLQEGRIRGRNREILQQIAKHHTLVLVSGRPLSSVQFLAEDAGLFAYSIGCNGAVAADPMGEILFSRPMAPEAVEELLRIGERQGTYLHYYTADTFYSPYYWPERVEHLEAMAVPQGFFMQCNLHLMGLHETPMVHGVLKLQYTLPDDAAASAAVVKAVTQIPGIHHTYSGGGLLEAMAPEVDKWQAVRHVADSLSILPGDILAMGDYDNDAGMIEQAGVGVAMGNAPERVQEKADFVTRTVDEDGAYYALEALRQDHQWNEAGEDPEGENHGHTSR